MVVNLHIQTEIALCRKNRRASDADGEMAVSERVETDIKKHKGCR
jgi:hypothetical protein